MVGLESRDGIDKGGRGLPASFPPVVKSGMAWTGKQVGETSDYIVKLDSQDIAELEEALESFKSLGLDGDAISRDNFTLARLGPRLEEVRWQVHEGRGFGLVRGLQVEKYGVEDLTMLYLGIQCYVGNEYGRQDAKGNMLVHIIADDSSEEKAAHQRHSTGSIVSGH
ncbi:hypothetical protein CDD82_895 [Ophiocordyceps australis]|uniref:TauD/TfdA-like domain-containing protein n=1 Tax=Ophiocordyceps australis TaxID=1399860 RepID=A0A2C5YH06_9HYPO|nr:hypothetical protein CDD82_895 [Ophiocordyceps australis]